MDRLTWFITGTSRGFGAELARQALERGDNVAATARDPQVVEAALTGYGERLLPLALDVTDEAGAEAAVARAVERFGRLDVVANNAGSGLVGAVEEASAEEVRELFETNVYGVLAVLRAVLPVLRRQRSGRILNMSSVFGFSVGAGWGVYGATKFAVEGISEALGEELAPLGIAVTLVEPGAFRTDFLEHGTLRRSARAIDEYTQTAGASRAWADNTRGAQMGDPVKAAAAMIRAATADDPPLRLPLGADCVARVEQKLTTVARELDRWRPLALSTAVDVASAA
jgi:NAD(P)-dependent dehydrogenase (short-subunit alcohol dehydrogenase family)